jgi:hypothetical protein
MRVGVDCQLGSPKWTAVLLFSSRKALDAGYVD